MQRCTSLCLQGGAGGIPTWASFAFSDWWVWEEWRNVLMVPPQLPAVFPSAFNPQLWTGTKTFWWWWRCGLVPASKPGICLEMLNRKFRCFLFIAYGMLHMSSMIGFLWRGSVFCFVFFSFLFFSLFLQLKCAVVRQSKYKCKTIWKKDWNRQIRRKHRGGWISNAAIWPCRSSCSKTNEAFPQHHPATLHTRKHAHRGF